MAGGLGIDLTAASIVIHYDRWWNAARENQATDRVHRIGQSRGVQVFKLITRGTLEDKIDKMIREKASLLDSIVEEDAATLKALTREELVDLLTSVPGDAE
jgi:SNF2 family DNA or RNA helicase